MGQRMLYDDILLIVNTLKIYNPDSDRVYYNRLIDAILRKLYTNDVKPAST